MLNRSSTPYLYDVVVTANSSTQRALSNATSTNRMAEGRLSQASNGAACSTSGE